MAENPFEYSEHLKFNIDYEKTLAEAARLRIAGVSHKQAHNILPEGSTIRRVDCTGNQYRRVRKPAHIAAQRAREFEQTVTTLHKQWSQTAEPEFRTAILPTPSQLPDSISIL